MVPFIGVSDLSAFLGQDVSADALAVIAIDSACEIIRSYVEQTLNYVANDVVFVDGSGGRGLLLPQIPVVSVGAVQVEGEDAPVDPATMYVTAGGVLYRAEVWPVGWGNVSVTYSHGYAVFETDVENDPTDNVPLPVRMPSDIRRVALSLSQRIFVSSGSSANTGTRTSETISTDAYSQTFANTSGSSSSATSFSGTSDFGADEKAILDLHRVQRVA